jgi:hypothetical protein
MNTDASTQTIKVERHFREVIGKYVSNAQELTAKIPDLPARKLKKLRIKAKNELNKRNSATAHVVVPDNITEILEGALFFGCKFHRVQFLKDIHSLGVFKINCMPVERITSCGIAAIDTNPDEAPAVIEVLLEYFNNNTYVRGVEYADWISALVRLHKFDAAWRIVNQIPWTIDQMSKFKKYVVEVLNAGGPRLADLIELFVHTITHENAARCPDFITVTRLRDIFDTIVERDYWDAYLKIKKRLYNVGRMYLPNHGKILGDSRVLTDLYEFIEPRFFIQFIGFYVQSNRDLMIGGGSPNEPSNLNWHMSRNAIGTIRIPQHLADPREAIFRAIATFLRCKDVSSVIMLYIPYGSY